MKGLAEVTERYNLEPKDNGIIGIHRRMTFELKSKADILTKNKRE